MGKGHGECFFALRHHSVIVTNGLLTVLNADVQPFEQITALTDVAEGTVVRVITRLDETCREVRDAARVIGDADLMKKMEEAQIKIKRDSESRLLFFCTVGVLLTGLMQLYSLLACISECKYPRTEHPV